MSPKEWKELKDQLIARGLNVKVAGRQKKEYIASTDYMTLDILRGGIGHSSSMIEVFVYGESFDNIISHDEYRDITKLLKVIDGYIADYKEFGSII